MVARAGTAGSARLARRRLGSLNPPLRGPADLRRSA